MSDARQRELERSAAGDPHARARLLAERLRAGDLPQARLALVPWALGATP